jgi:symplekin
MPLLQLQLHIPQDLDMCMNDLLLLAITDKANSTYHPEEAETWNHLQAIKNAILSQMDSYPPSIKACCVKFIQRVVQTQTPGIIDPRRPDKNETSLALVPRDHPLIQVSHVEAETSGLLDRVLGVLQDETSDALLITATINALGALIKSRVAIANKIINTILSYNPLVLAGDGSISTKHKILIRSVERTIKALFFNIMRRTPTHPQAPRMQAYLERLSAGRVALFEESRKRPAPSDLRQESPKKQRIQPLVEDPFALPPGPVSYQQLFTLSKDPAAQPFDVTAIPISTVAKILVPLLRSVDGHKLDEAITLVQGRISALNQRAAAQQMNQSVDDDDDYEPEFSPMEDAEQVRNRMDLESSADLGIGIPSPSQVRLLHFKLPDPLRLAGRDLELLGRQTMDHIFRKIETAPKAAPSATKKIGFNRLAATGDDRESKVTTFARLLSRPSACSPEEQETLVGGLNPQVLCDRGRMQMLQYILSNWKARMDVATTWLTEEWYNDQVCKQVEAKENVDKSTAHQPNFQKWAHRFLDELSAFIGSEDSKLLIRFVSDIPGLDRDIIAKIKRLAMDPERITMVVNSIQ